jgi:hypothetical protein
MPQYFKERLNRGLSQQFIDTYAYTRPVTDFDCYGRLGAFLTERELRETQRSILLLTKYLLEHRKFIFPSTANEGKIYRAGKLNSGDAGNGYFPISKSAASNCPTPGEPLEPIWFGLEPLYRYLNLNPQEPYGLVSCRKIKDVGNDLGAGRQREKKCNMVVNLSRDDADGAGYLLSTSLQTAINRAILIPIVRGFCGNYSRSNYPRDLTYDYIVANARMFSFTGTVNGYNCDTARYAGGTIETLLQSWSMVNGTRASRYNEDRIQIQVLFEVFEWVEGIINNGGREIFKKALIDSLKTVVPEATYTTKFNLIGWFCRDTPRGRDGSIFPGEYALSIKYFAPPIRYQIFDKQREDCRPRFFVLDRNSREGYQEVAGPPGGPAQVAPPPAVFGFGVGVAPAANPFAPRPPAPNPFAAPVPVGLQAAFAAAAAREAAEKRIANLHGFPPPLAVAANPFAVANRPLGANIMVPPARWRRGGGLEDEEKEYYYSKEPESPDSDLFQVFFENNPEEEEKYTDEPKGVAEIIKKYGEEQEKRDNTKSNEFNPKAIARGRSTGSTIRPQSSIRTQGGKLSKKYKRKSFKKISKKYKKRYSKKRPRKIY